MRLFGLLLLVFALNPAVAGVQVADGRVVESSAGTQIIFSLSAPVKYSSFLLDDPPRFVVDLGNARLNKSGLPLQSADVQGVRAGPRNGSDLRLVVDLTALWRGEVRAEPASSGSGQQLIISILRNQQPDSREIGLGAAVRGGVSPTPVQSRTAYRKVASRKEVVIAIDPGHGGKDPGAIGPRHTREKEVVMQISRRLQALIDREPGMRAVLTRNGDHYLHLHQRIEAARKHRADVFISVHADAYDRSSANGSSVFILSTKGASSTAARWLAKKENEADLIGGGFAGVEDNLKPVVFDIYHDAVLADSMLLAEQVLGRLSRIGNVHSGHVERAGFAVLKGPDMPSILVETAFISNPEEEARLRGPHHQEKLAQAIFQGIRAYLDKKPPLETYLMVADTTPAEPAAAPVSTPTPAAAAPKPSAAPKPAAAPVALPAVQLIAKAAAPPPLPAVQLVGRSATPAARPAANPRHTIRNGESLGDIAQRYRIDLRRLRSANGLRDNQLRMPAGTTLTIPLDS
jgi:N-acetylmuramoyl-L-alanine amidase